MMADDKRKWWEELASAPQVSLLNEPVAPETADERAKSRSAGLKVIDGGKEGRSDANG